MTTLEICDRLADEYNMPAGDLANQLAGSYDGLTLTERNLTSREVDLSRHATSFDAKTLAAAMFTVTRKVELHFYFDFQQPQIPSGD